MRWFWLAVAASIGWHARSTLQWAIERAGEAPAARPDLTLHVDDRGVADAIDQHRRRTGRPVAL